VRRQGVYDVNVRQATCTVLTVYSLRNDASCSAAEVPLTDLKHPQTQHAKLHTIKSSTFPDRGHINREGLL